MRRYRREAFAKPRLIRAQRAGQCACGKKINPGDEAVYYPSSRKVECRACGTRALEALADEQFGG